MLQGEWTGGFALQVNVVLIRRHAPELDTSDGKDARLAFSPCTPEPFSRSLRASLTFMRDRHLSTGYEPVGETQNESPHVIG